MKSSNDVVQSTAKLAFSPDASILAVGMSMTSAVSLIDTTSGTLHSTFPGFFDGLLVGLGLLDRYLITLSKELRIWDLVDEELHYGLTFDSENLVEESHLAYNHLAVDQKHNTFAVAIPETGLTSKGANKGLRSRLAVFDIEFPEPLCNTLQPIPLIAILPIADKKGYYCINSAAEVRTLISTPKLPAFLKKQPEILEMQPSIGLGNIYGNGKVNETKPQQQLLKLAGTNSIADRSVEEDDAKVVSADKLAEVFETGSGSALLSVSDMFEQVAALFAGRNDL